MLETLKEIIHFLNENKEIVGATTVLTEVLIIIINFIRKIRAERVPEGAASAKQKTSFIKKLIWSANPLNLRRKP